MCAGKNVAPMSLVAHIDTRSVTGFSMTAVSVISKQIRPLARLASEMAKLAKSASPSRRPEMLTLISSV